MMQSKTNDAHRSKQAFASQFGLPESSSLDYKSIPWNLQDAKDQANFLCDVLAMARDLHIHSLKTSAYFVLGVIDFKSKESPTPGEEPGLMVGLDAEFTFAGQPDTKRKETQRVQQIWLRPDDISATIQQVFTAGFDRTPLFRYQLIDIPENFAKRPNACKLGLLEIKAPDFEPRMRNDALSLNLLRIGDSNKPNPSANEYRNLHRELKESAALLMAATGSSIVLYMVMQCIAALTIRSVRNAIVPDASSAFVLADALHFIGLYTLVIFGNTVLLWLGGQWHERLGEQLQPISWLFKLGIRVALICWCIAFVFDFGSILFAILSE